MSFFTFPLPNNQLYFGLKDFVKVAWLFLAAGGVDGLKPWFLCISCMLMKNLKDDNSL